MAFEDKTCWECIAFRWPDPQPAVWVDHHGDAHCAFHAPKEEKRRELGSENRLSLHEFNDRVFARIDAVRARTQAGEAEAECVFSATIFPGDISFLRYSKAASLPSINFMRAVFTGKTDFGWCNFSGSANFSKATFGGPTSFIEIVARDGALDMSDQETKSLGNLVFTRNELPLFTFRNPSWPEILGLEAYQYRSLPECEELYRALKQRAVSDQNQPLVSRWHYREKLMGLKHLTRYDMYSWLPLMYPIARGHRRIPWLLIRLAHPFLGALRVLRALPSLTFWYWVSSGFGERPQRASATLLALLVPLFVIFLGAELVPGQSVAANLAAVQSATIDHLAQQSHAVVPTAWGRVLAMLQHLMFVTNPVASPRDPLLASVSVLLTRIFIPLQFALFALAVRNRFRR